MKYASKTLRLFSPGAREVVVKCIWKSKHAENIWEKPKKKRKKKQWMVAGRPDQIVEHIKKPQKLKWFGISP